MARPRQFDIEAALRVAMTLFWERGYDGVSLNELATAMGIVKPSLYAAFGDKQALFEAAVRLYDSTTGAPAMAALDSATTARTGVEQLLQINAYDYSAADRPAGCMIVLAGAAGGVRSPTKTCAFLAQCRRDGEEAIRRRLARGIAEGDLDAETDIVGTAAFYTTVLYGLSVRARDGAPHDALQAIVAQALRAWPAP